jgi:succinylarginine dihydrolase
MVDIGYEVNFDGLVGPTHNYSGLSYGNIASMTSQNTPSSPKEAALQGLKKMKFLHDLGLKQGVLPPHERPHLPSLKILGFTGADRTIPEKTYKVNPLLLFNYSSASPMWAANSVTFTPSIDSSSGKAQITPANLSSTRHRTIEAKDTSKILKAIFSNDIFFEHHEPLPYGNIFNDEGSANHTRFCKEYEELGVHLFVYGMRSLEEWAPRPKKFPARQTLEASETIVRSHKIFPERYILAQQSPIAIDAGVFHNDVIAVGERNLFFYHENAFLNSKALIEEIRKKVEQFCDVEMRFIEVPASAIPLQTAVETYLFNSQLVYLSDKSYTLLSPIECRDDGIVFTYLNRLIKDPDNPIRDVHFIDTKESMRNGGGPACLRTRFTFNQNELNNTNPKCLLNDKLYEKLINWIETHYRDRLEPKDLRDPKLVDETQAALNELTHILDLGNIYSFQQ